MTENQRASNILLQVVMSNQAKLIRAEQRRAEMWERVNSGTVSADDRRFLFLTGSANEVVKLLGGLAETFNQGGDDRATVQDLLDILEQASFKLRKASGQG